MARVEGPAAPCGPVGREHWWFVPVPDQPGQWFRVRAVVVAMPCPLCGSHPGVPCRRTQRRTEPNSRNAHFRKTDYKAQHHRERLRETPR